MSPDAADVPDATGRGLPAHIAAALAAAGGRADSAGQDWAGRSLDGDGPYHNFEDDDGVADPAFAAAFAALLNGTGSEAGVVAALAGARVFVPIVAELAEADVSADGLTADKESDMALVTLQAPDGRRVLPAFSSTAALEAWHPQSRPVAVYAARAALSAVADETQLMVVDPGSDFAFVIRRPALWALARQQEWLPCYADPEVLAALTPDPGGGQGGKVATITAGPGSGTAGRTSAGTVVAGGGPGPELRVELGIRAGLDRAGLDILLAGLQEQWSRKKIIADRVDSMEISAHRADE